MRSVFIYAALLICGVPTIAQNPSAPHASGQTPRRASPPVQPPPSLADVPADTAVVTLNGVCDATAQSKGETNCKTVLTRAQMDKIVDTLATLTPLVSRQQLAINYVRMLAAVDLAQKRELDKKPEVARELKEKTTLGRAKALTQALYRQMEEEAENPSTAEIQQYYADHQAEYDQAELLRLSLPKTKLAPGAPPISPKLLKEEADSLHKRAVAGYDFDQLQKLAYEDLGITAELPPTKMALVRRKDLSPDEAKVFDLKPGEVTDVIDSYTSVLILKLVSKQGASLDSVMTDIKTDMRHARLLQEIQTATKSVTAEFNLQYIGMKAQPVLFPLPGSPQSQVLLGPSPEQRKRSAARKHTATAPGEKESQPQAKP
jgi:hypothetical protein